MKIFTNLKVWQKIAIALVIVLICEFTVASFSRVSLGDGDDDKDDNSSTSVRSSFSWAGVLMNPIMSFVVTVGDGVMTILHKAILGQSSSIIHVDTHSDFDDILNTLRTALAGGLAILGAVLMATGVGIPAGILAEIAAGALILVPATLSYAEQFGKAMETWQPNQAPDEIDLPLYNYSPEEIFKGNILLFNVDFFSKPVQIKEKKDKDGNLKYYYYEKNGKEIITSKQDSGAFLQRTISSWYKVIRNICIVLMLSVLVYVGIRMLLTSIANEKAKYKEMLKDWFVGLCLLFVMHYIMAFSVTLVNGLTNIIDASVDSKSYIAFIPDKDGKIKDTLTKMGIDAQDGTFKYTDENGKEKDYKAVGYQTNLMGYLRISIQMADLADAGLWIGESILYIMLVTFTILYTFVYLKRLLYMAFLTLIAPVVALTYCIDKLNDGQAQGFNRWFKEYIFNLLIQPMHLLLYYVLVTSAFELASQNVIYSVVAIGFMLPAEKLLRSLFGFEKAQTPNMLTGAAGTALMMQGINKLSGAVKNIGIGKSSSKSTQAANTNNKIAENENKTKSRFPNSKNDVDTNATMLAENNDGNDVEDGSVDYSAESPMVTDENGTYEDYGISGVESPRTVSGYTNTNNGIVAGASTDGLNYGSNYGNNPRIDVPDRFNQDYPRTAGGLLLTPEVQRKIDEEKAAKAKERQEKLLKEQGQKQANAIRTAQSAQLNGGPKKTVSGYAKNIGNKAKPEVVRLINSHKRASKVAAARAKSRDINYQPIKSAGKAAAKFAIGAPAAIATATLAGSAAAASGDPSKVITAVGTAGGFGVVAGQSGQEAAAKALDYSTEDYRDAFKEAYHGEEYEKKDLDKYVSKRLDDDELHMDIEDSLKNDKRDAKESRKMTSEMYKNGTIEKIMRADSVDESNNKEIVVGAKGISDGEFNSVDHYAAALNTYKRMGSKSPKKMGDAREKWQKTLAKEYVEAGNGKVSQSQANKIAKKTIKQVQWISDNMD